MVGRWDDQRSLLLRCLSTKVVVVRRGEQSIIITQEAGGPRNGGGGKQEHEPLGMPEFSRPMRSFLDFLPTGIIILFIFGVAFIIVFYRCSSGHDHRS